MESQQREKCPHCLEVLDALGGFFLLEKRSATLDGSIPFRAAQGCIPFLEGNAVGFQLRPAAPMLLHISEGVGSLQVEENLLAYVSDRYAASITKLVERGLLQRGGYWHHRLQQGFAWQDGDLLSLWTGFLVRPAPGLWTLLSGAFNRRSLISIEEYVMTDASTFLPLVLRLTLSSAHVEQTWLESEMGCLLPLRPHVEVVTCSLEEAPGAGEQFNHFYSAEYLERRGERKSTGHYKKLLGRAADESHRGPTPCRFVLAAGEQLHSVETFERYITDEGFATQSPADGSVAFGVVRNLGEISGAWDGLAFRELTADISEVATCLKERWATLYGEESIAHLDWCLEYVGDPPPPLRGDPHLILTPWVFFMSPPGWSCIVDGYHQGKLDGLRGVIATDVFHMMSFLYQFHDRQRFTIPRGVVLGRLLPVPRDLLQCPYQGITLDTVGEA